MEVNNKKTLYDLNNENIISTFNKIILEYNDYSVNYSTSPSFKNYIPMKKEILEEFIANKNDMIILVCSYYGLNEYYFCKNNNIYKIHIKITGNYFYEVTRVKIEKDINLSYETRACLSNFVECNERYPEKIIRCVEIIGAKNEIDLP